ncbi:MAG: S8 family serine peptidase [Acidobacteria bacterium]|nr:S8 family serine peptidase [Acidobacteriota bacterium]
MAAALVGATLAARPDAQGRRELLVRVEGTPGTQVDEVRLEAGPFSDAHLPPAWTLRKNGAAGPAVTVPLHLRFTLDGTRRTPGRVRVEVRMAGRVLVQLQAAPEELGPLRLAREPDQVVAVPPAVQAGESLELAVLDVKRAPPGGRWTIAGVEAVERGSRLEVRLPATLQAGDLIPLRYRDPWGGLAVDGPAANTRVVLSESAGDSPRILSCSPGFVNQTLCVCGNFPPASWAGLRLDGRSLDRPAAASSRSLLVWIPEGVKPGLHVVSGDPEAGFTASDRVMTTVMHLSAQVDQAAILRGASTTAWFQLLGSALPLALKIANEDPAIIRMEGGDEQLVSTSGGEPNGFRLGLRGLAKGNYTIRYKRAGELCPCAAQEALRGAGSAPAPPGPPAPPSAQDPRGFLRARVLSLIPLASPPAMAATAQALAATHGVAVAEVSPLVSTNDGLVVFTIPDATDVPIKVAALAADPRVRLAQPDFLFETSGQESMQYAGRLMRTDHLDPSLSGQGITVAVIDTGVDARHPRLSGRISARANVTGAADAAGIHGTLVAGIVGGVAARAGILSVQACLPLSAESIRARCTSVTLAKAVDLALERKARVLNLSVGGPRDRLLERLIDEAVKRSSVVVAATLLERAAADLGPPGKDPLFGSGLVDGLNLFRSVSDLPGERGQSPRKK